LPRIWRATRISCAGRWRATRNTAAWRLNSKPRISGHSILAIHRERRPKNLHQVSRRWRATAEEYRLFQDYVFRVMVDQSGSCTCRCTFTRAWALAIISACATAMC
jgi:hypothetical protein